MTSRRLLAACACCAAALLFVFLRAPSVEGEIPKPTDAPQPLPPEESLREFSVPEGFRLELVASEPLIHEPSGVCWDAHGRLFVSELHGFNMAGQYDIEALNKTGELDHVVRRIEADDKFKEMARDVTYGVIKQLIDTDGDGRADKAETFVERIPACHGLCPARDGIIAICAPDVLFLADRDGDGKAEVREVLYTGFSNAQLERSISSPQWGIDGWIYAGRGSSASTITGPHLKEPVNLPHTDFRFKPDGSAIEPVAGSSYTMGFAITEEGDRYVMSTGTPFIYCAPIPWHYLTRNPQASIPSLEYKTRYSRKVYPICRPHPWRTKRAEDPGFSEYYSKRYGAAESTPDGFFTSACSPLVYQGHALPGLNGEYFICEPAGSLIHRGLIEGNGVQQRLVRPDSEKSKEFLASRDSWFHPIALGHGPDDCIYITDFYREIIEDYSAVPRYLQQQYELNHGSDRGRIWRLTHPDVPQAAPSDMTKLSTANLVTEVGSPAYWRRETARRLIEERHDASAVAGLEKMASTSTDAAAVVGALYALESLDALSTPLLEQMMQHPAWSVRVHAMQLSDARLDSSPTLRDAVIRLADDKTPRVSLQVALSLGEMHDPRALPTLAKLSHTTGRMQWQSIAMLSSIPGRAGEFLSLLLTPEPTTERVEECTALLEPVCNCIAARRDADELSKALVLIGGLSNPDLQALCLQGLQHPFRRPVAIDLTQPAREALYEMAKLDGDVRHTADRLIVLMRVETPEHRVERVEEAAKRLGDVQNPLKERLAALGELSDENEPAVTDLLLNALPDATPELREGILEALFANRDRLPRLLDAIEQNKVPKSVLTAVQRTALFDHEDPALRDRAKKLLAVNDGEMLASLERFTAALKGARDAEHGEKVFRDKCATCHAVRGVGFAVGPDLAAEFQRAEETVVRDILLPSEQIAAGYVTYIVETTDGQILTGLISGESATTISLKQPGGKEVSILRQDVATLKASPVSIMPEDLAKNLAPQDVADVITWLRMPR